MLDRKALFAKTNAQLRHIAAELDAKLAAAAIENKLPKLESDANKEALVFGVLARQQALLDAPIADEGKSAAGAEGAEDNAGAHAETSDKAKSGDNADESMSENPNPDLGGEIDLAKFVADVAGKVFDAAATEAMAAIEMRLSDKYDLRIATLENEVRKLGGNVSTAKRTLHGSVSEL
jgi:hypothetical protein